VRLEDDIQHAIGVLHELNPRAVRDEVRYLTSDRIKSPNLDGMPHAQATEPPLPLPDRLDKHVRQQQRMYIGEIEGAARLLSRALVRQRDLLVRLHDEHGAPTEEARKLAAGDGEECANCTEVVAKVTDGRCRACAEYLKRTEKERPADLWVK
jgi:hypothetical protein